MAHIDDVPSGVTGAGQDYDYNSVPIAVVTVVYAPVDSEHTVIGRTRADYDAYIDNENAEGRALVHNVQILDPRDGFKLETTINAAAEYNYARVVMGTRRWYMFIDRMEWLSPSTIAFHTTVDPFPTYPGWGLGYSLIERSHAAVAASQGDTYGNLYCGAPEPISAPPERNVQSVEVLSSTISGWTVIVISANDLRGNGTGVPYFRRHVLEEEINGAQQQAWLAGRSPAVLGSDDDFYPTGDGPNSNHGFVFSDYGAPYPWRNGDDIYIPDVHPSPVSRIDGIAQGGGAYLFTPAGYANWLTVMQGASWVVEGITDIRIVPTWAVSGGGGGGSVGSVGAKNPTAAVWEAAAAIPNYVQSITTNQFDQTVLTGWRETYLSNIDGEYFRKLVTGPHTRIVIGAGEGSEEFDPTLMRSSGVTVHAQTGLAHGEPDIRITADYNLMGDQKPIHMGAGGHPGVVASGYGRAAANTGQADMAPVNAAMQNYASRQTTEYNMVMAKHFETEKVAMNMGIIGVQSVLQAGGGAALAGLAGAGPIGAVAGAVVGGASAAVTAGVSSNNSLDLQDISLGGSLDIASYQLAVNGAFAVMSFRAWVQALDSVSGKGSSAALSAAWRLVTGQGFRVTVMAPTEDNARRLIATWRRYGYMIGRAFRPSRLDVMTRYSYWKTADAVITGRMPQEARAKIAAAFDAGVTVYESLNDIGVDVSQSNAPVSGFVY
jgi:hypothetical protein